MEITHYADSAWSLIPPLAAVTLAVVTRKVLLSLGVGIVLGCLLVNQFAPMESAQYLGQITKGIFWADGAINSWNVNIVIFLLLLGGIISLLTVSGATFAFAEWAASRIKDRRGAKLLTGLLVFLFFIDDYFHSLSVGTICRPLTDRFNISRAKLAYLLDSTAAPVCVLMPISSWGAYIIALIGGILTAHGITEVSPISAFIQLIPMNFYALFTLAMVIVVILFQLDIGAMRQHETRAQAGQLWDSARGTPAGSGGDLPVSSKGRVYDLVLPILTLTVSTVYFMMATGAAKLAAGNLPFSVLGAFENTDVGASLVNGGLCGLGVAVILTLRMGLGLRTWIGVVKHGVMAMLPAIYILVFAWGIGAVIRDVETGKYLASMAQSGLPIELLPVVMFCLSGAMAFATGTSWGTFGVMLPLAGDMAAASEIAMMLPMLSAVLAGAVFGDHCSPISDTTILSSTGAGSHHIDHVMTQLPYALTIAFGAALGYLVLGMSHNVWAGLLTSGLWFIGVTLFCLRADRRQAAVADATA